MPFQTARWAISRCFKFTCLLPNLTFTAVSQKFANSDLRPLIFLHGFIRYSEYLSEEFMLRIVETKKSWLKAAI
ncbi:hypothetical protein SAMN06296036_104286 [Pseudobacteriovorax antillogorgiicola]|uniref:Uncharacterized protein n=1 Tax=Pseudobacteriovorax antillogorgiicola TaxID=1513793 RepID=A0A1Y6BFD5_9BACT|nr:hypothetical protein SAMN06296036_104286 [Pseudobacteriovorax antillogorgiicola]